MNTLYKNFKLQLLVLVVLLSASFGFAQVVGVPAGCTVVVAGTGGTVGASGIGQVGNGGQVIMPDPSGGGKFGFSIAGVATAAIWSLKGDLTNTATLGGIFGFSGFYDGVTQPPFGASATIITYNKKLRTTSSEGPNPTLARSKGQVKVSWSVPGCGSFITFDVFKTFTSIPNIVGPTCIEPNKVYTFSIDQIASDNANDNIGFDKYYWSGYESFIQANSSYFSADNSSITFRTIATGLIPFTLKCCVGRYNTTLNVDGGDGPEPITVPTAVNYLTCTTSSLILVPTGPTYVTAPPSCHPTGSASFNIVYPNIPVTNPVTTYAWTAPNTGWTIGAAVIGATNTTVTVTTPNNNPGELALTINGPCLPVIIKYQINRNLAAPLTIIPTSPTITTCINLGGSGNYTISPNASANPVIWSTNPAIITGVTLSNATTSTVTVNIASNVTVPSFTLQVKSSIATCNATSIATIIYVRPATPTITGPAPSCIARGTTTTTAISCNAVTGATGYSWNLTGAPGWSISANGTTVNPTFIPNGTSAGPVTISVTALGVSGQSCDSNPSANFTVNYSPVAPNVNAITCWNTAAVMPTKTLTINNLQNFGTYSVVANAALFSGSSISGSTITLNNAVFLSAGSYSITVRHSNGTCTPANTVLNFTVLAATSTVAFNGPNGIVDNYTYALAVGETFVSWIVNNNVVTANGSTISTVLNQLSLAGTTVPATSVGVIVNVGGCLRRVFSPTVGTRGASRQSNSSNTTIKEITISPNPNDGNFIITALNFKETATAILYDINGRVITAIVLNKGENKIEKAGLTKGTYIVSLLVDGKTESRKIIIK